jgi:hypothetical protein
MRRALCICFSVVIFCLVFRTSQAEESISPVSLEEVGYSTCGVAMRPARVQMPWTRIRVTKRQWYAWIDSDHTWKYEVSIGGEERSSIERAAATQFLRENSTRYWQAHGLNSGPISHYLAKLNFQQLKALLGPRGRSLGIVILGSPIDLEGQTGDAPGVDRD